MNKFKILGILSIVCGVALFGMSVYIKSEVEEGKTKIRKAEKTMDQGDSLLSHNRAAKRVGKEFSKPVQKKIEAGKEEVAHYEALASKLKVIGIFLVLVGAAVLFIRKKR